MSLEDRSASIGVPHLEDTFVFGDSRFVEQQPPPAQQCRCASATIESPENGNKCHPRVDQELSSSARSPASRGTSPCDPTIIRIEEASPTESPEKFANEVAETIEERSRNNEMSAANSTLSLETSSSSSDPDQRIIHGRLTVDNEETSRQRGLTVGGVSRRHHHNNHPHHHHHHHHHQHQQTSQIEDFTDPNRFEEARSLREKNRANTAGNDSKSVHSDVDELRRIDDTSPSNVVNYSPGFRNFHHQEHMIVQQQQTPLQRGIGSNNPANAKGNFDPVQVSTGMIAMEKSKCQCHQIQPHQQQQQQQPMSHLQQREQSHSAASPQHHHHHHQQSQPQEQESHRRKFSHQRNQPQQQQQQQNYRHHHYHHPHQHIGQQQQQQDQRGQSEQTMASGMKLSNSGTDESDDMMLEAGSHHQPPALPPRPPPRPNRRYEHNPNAPYDLGPNNGDDTGCCKKYVVLCCLCGGLSAAVGSLFLAVHAVLSAHTASLALFETVPSYIPGTMLILMGLFTILLARRKHRYGFLMKMCGSVGVVCALVCVLVTVTTTVVHMSRLQGLRECIYTEIARSCTCYGSTQGRILSDPGVLFEETPHCEVVHGALYDCLRALFGVSVAGILACIFSCMLLYQLLSHEKKKMYWEQLQLRCRSLYGQGGSGAVVGATGGSCGCCNDCGGTSPWWAQTPGNLYTPNPDLAPFRRWRLPWSRSRGPAPTPDSNYGFHTTQSRGAVVMRSSGSSSGEPGENTPGPYSVLTDESQTGGGAPYSLINSTSSGAPYAACASSVASYSLLENGPPVPAALWGPPPPYSDPNSPARRPIPLNNEERRAAVSMRSPGNTGTPVNLNNRIISGTKRMDNFEAANCEEYRQRVARPSDNYENTEEVLSSSTDPDIELGNLHHHNHHHHHHHHLSQQRQQQQQQQQQDEDGTNKASRRTRKLLKGVENGAFQQETGNNSLTKQSESELYFGDVSSCCGPESSFYDLAVEKEQQSGPVETSEAPIDHPPSNRFAKQRLSPKRSPRQPAPLPVNLSPEGSLVALGENYPVALSNSPCSGATTTVVDDLSRSSSTRGPYLAPDAQYEVIAQQTRYTYYNTMGSSGTGDPDGDRVDAVCHDYPNERIDVSGVVAGKPKSGGTPVAKSPSPSIVPTPPSSPRPGVSSLSPRSSNNETGFAHFRDRQVVHQTRSSEGVCPVNV